MKKAALILMVLVTTGLFSWYIFDPGKEDALIGHQSDDILAMLETESEEIPANIESFEPEPIDEAELTPTASGSETAGVTKPGGWSLFWSDEFDAPLLNLEYWTEIDRRNNYNGELQYYTPANSYIENGCLTITAKREQMDDRQFTSGMVHSLGKMEMLYGCIEARISLPVAQGIFPAFWLLTESNRHELDVIEMVGCEPGNIYGVCHFKNKGKTSKEYGMIHIDDPEAFHIYALECEEDEVRWYVDGVQYYSTRNGIPDEPLYIILTLAVGGDWPGDPDTNTEFPVYMSTDYIRIYSRKTEGSTP